MTWYASVYRNIGCKEYEHDVIVYQYKKSLKVYYFTTYYSNRQKLKNIESDMRIKNTQPTPTHSQLKEALKGFIHEVCCQTLLNQNVINDLTVTVSTTPTRIICLKIQRRKMVCPSCVRRVRHGGIALK